MRSSTFRIAWCVALVACFFAGCGELADMPGLETAARTRPAESGPAARGPSAPESPAIVKAARRQVGLTTIYDPAYVVLRYPGGDLPIERGVCSDVVIRALREALKMDLQKLVHEDMSRAFSRYPRRWGLRRPDRNIDHRRVLNLQTYFERKGYSLGVSREVRDYRPGDIVTCTIGGNLPHIMIVSDSKTRAGAPLVIHNIGRGAMEEDCLFDFPITGHYRVGPVP